MFFSTDLNISVSLFLSLKWSALRSRHAATRACSPHIRPRRRARRLRQAPWQRRWQRLCLTKTQSASLFSGCRDDAVRRDDPAPVHTVAVSGEGRFMQASSRDDSRRFRQLQSHIAGDRSSATAARPRLNRLGNASTVNRSVLPAGHAALRFEDNSEGSATPWQRLSHFFLLPPVGGDE